MLDFKLYLVSLNEIIYQKKSFKEVIFSINAKERISAKGKKEFKDDLLNILSGYVRLSFMIDKTIEDETNDNEHLLSIITLYFLIKNESEDIFSSYKETFTALNLIGDYNLKFDKIKERSIAKFTIPEEIEKNSPLYLSLTFGIPLNIISILIKEYSYGAISSFAYSKMNKPVFYYYSQGDFDDFFVRIKLSPEYIGQNLYYRTKKNLSIINLIDNNLYPIDYILNFALDGRFEKLADKDITIFNSEDISPVCTFKQFENNNIACVFKDALKYRKAIENANKLRIKDAKFLLEDEQTNDSFMSDLVVYYGEDSKIAMASYKPGLYLSISDEDIKESYNKEREDINRLALFVKKDGYLIFINHSILNVEGKKVIDDFLSLHHEFVLETEKQVVITDEPCGYYAIIRRIL